MVIEEGSIYYFYKAGQKRQECDIFDGNQTLLLYYNSPGNLSSDYGYSFEDKTPVLIFANIYLD